MPILQEMVHKLFNDEDKFERMFAAQYLAKYMAHPQDLLKKALNDNDPEVRTCIQSLIHSSLGKY